MGRRIKIDADQLAWESRFVEVSEGGGSEGGAYLAVPCAGVCGAVGGSLGCGLAAHVSLAHLAPAAVRPALAVDIKKGGEKGRKQVSTVVWTWLSAV